MTWVSSKFITYTYYGTPVDHVTVSVDVDSYMEESARLLAIENALQHLEFYPVEQFPVAGAYSSLLPLYFARHPNLAFDKGDLV